MYYFVVLAVASYCVFVLVSETIVPFRVGNTPRNIRRGTRHRRRLAYWCAASILFAGAFVHYFLTPLTDPNAMITSFVVAALLAAPAVTFYLFRKYMVAEI